MAEMMVNLRALRAIEPVLTEQAAKGVEIRRAHPSESNVIANWVREHINPSWGVPCEVALEQTPPECFIACRKKADGESSALKSADLLGFACYNVVKIGVFGPSGVGDDEADDGISTALLLASLHAMAVDNQMQATIGWASSADAYSG